MNRLLLLVTILTMSRLPLYSEEPKDQTKLWIGDTEVPATNVNGKLTGERWIKDGPNSIIRVQVTLDTSSSDPYKADCPECEPVLHLMLRTSDQAGNYTGPTIFHGKMYQVKSWKTPEIAKTNVVDIYATTDKTKIVIMVWDNGPIYSTTNSGLTWQTISDPGSYEFPLTIGTDGAGFFAAATIHPLATNVLVPKLPAGNWYATGQESSGGQIILTESLSQLAPALTIFPATNGVIISWSGELSNYVLQANSDLATTNWNDVTNSPVKVQDEYQVVIPTSERARFYRLKSSQLN